MRRAVLAVASCACLVAAVASSGCWPFGKAEVTPTNVARYGGMVMDSVKVAEQTVIALNAQHAAGFDDQHTATAMIVFDQIGRRGVELSKALDAWEHAKGIPKAFAEGNVKAILAAIRDLLLAVPQVGPTNYTDTLRAIAEYLKMIDQLTTGGGA